MKKSDITFHKTHWIYVVKDCAQTIIVGHILLQSRSTWIFSGTVSLFTSADLKKIGAFVDKLNKVK